jgi:hypothetical protein
MFTSLYEDLKSIATLPHSPVIHYFPARLNINNQPNKLPQTRVTMSLPIPGQSKIGT